MGAVPEWYRWLNAATRLGCSVMELVNHAEGLYWLHHAEAAMEAEQHAREQHANRERMAGAR